MISPVHWYWELYFTPAEMACRCGCQCHDMRAETMDRLVRVRVRFARPMLVTSAYRCLAHDMAVSPGPRRLRSHTMGQAVDVSVSGPDAYDLAALAIEERFTGVGLRQHGRHGSRIMHLDDARPRENRVIWTYNAETT